MWEERKIAQKYSHCYIRKMNLWIQSSYLTGIVTVKGETWMKTQWKVHTLRAQKNKWMSWNWSALQLGENLQIIDGCVIVFLLDVCLTIVWRLIGVNFFKRVYKCNCNVLCFTYSRELKELLRLIQDQGINSWRKEKILKRCSKYWNAFGS